MQNLLNRNSLLSLISAPVIWGGHFLASYVIVSLACAAAYTQPLLFGLDVVDIGVGIVTLAAVALLVYISVINHAKWQRTLQREAPGDDMSRFFALCSVMLCGLSAVAVIWVAFPTYVLPPCAA
jgi:Ca2+/Na+ antiporter